MPTLKNFNYFYYLKGIGNLPEFERNSFKNNEIKKINSEWEGSQDWIRYKYILIIN